MNIGDIEGQIALRVIVLLLAIGFVIVVTIMIFVKRKVIRQKTRIGKNPYIPVGSSAPKRIKEDLEKKINSTVKVRTEPRVFTAEYQDNWETYSKDSRYTFLYRLKAVDEFKTLQDAVLRVNSLLETPPTVSIRDFLIAAREIVFKGVSRSLIDRYCKMYNWAREDPAEFTEKHYKDLVQLQKQLLDCVSSNPGGGARGGGGVENPAHEPIVEGPATRSRRGSADSDDSQTALITLEDMSKQPSVKYVKKDKGMENEAVLHNC